MAAAIRWALIATASFGLAISPARAGLPSAPVEQWRWEGSLRDPDRPSTIGSPVVVRLIDDNGDGVLDESDSPKVLFLKADVNVGLSRVQVLEGADGADVAEIAHPELTSSMLAVADLDGDGAVEIVAGSSQRMVVLRTDGSVERTLSAPAGSSFLDFLALADLDQDGIGDVYSGPLVVSGEGSWSWVGAGPGTGRTLVLAGSLAAELDASSPGLELLAGPTLYSATGARLLEGPGLPDGLTAVTDFEGDGTPEIVLVTTEGPGEIVSSLWILDDRLRLLDGPLELERGSGAYAAGPVVADLDADGVPEVVVPTNDFVTAAEFEGGVLTRKWAAPVHAVASASGATAFDFDGDGASEIVYRDDDAWMIFDGFDGSELHREAFPSGTLLEIPVVANVDDDPNAEILVPALGVWFDTRGDLIVYEVPGSCTPRSVWNQVTAHVTNVEDDGGLPAAEPPSWSTHRSWQAQGGSCCSARVLAPLPDVVACVGERLVFDAGGLELLGCPDDPLHEWSDGTGVLGTEPLLDLVVDASADLTLTLSCPSDPACEVSDRFHVRADRRPRMGAASVTDLSDCSLGLLVEWEPADFGGAAGGSYSVYRSEGPAASCADALTRPPVASGLTDTRWLDPSTVGGERYVHVVQAENADLPAGCLPTGPGGGAVAESCLPAVVDEGDFARPAVVGAVLRVERVGDGEEAVWPAARALLPGEHFHLLLAESDPTEPFTRANPEADLGRRHELAGPGAERLFLDLRVANGCEEISEDEFPPSLP